MISVFVNTIRTLIWLETMVIFGIVCQKASNAFTVPANAVLALSFEGTDGQTTFTDLTGRHTPTSNSVNAKISTTRFVNGLSSLWLSVNNVYVRARTSGSSSADFIWGPGVDFSVYGNYFQTSGGSGGHMFSTGLSDASAGMTLLRTSTSIKLVTNTFTTILEVLDAYVANVWEKWEVRRTGGVIYILKNNVIVGSVANNATLGNGNMYIGGNGAFGSEMVGFIDNFVVTKN